MGNKAELGQKTIEIRAFASPLGSNPRQSGVAVQPSARKTLKKSNSVLEPNVGHKLGRLLPKNVFVLWLTSYFGGPNFIRLSV